MDLHWFLDWEYGGDDALRDLLGQETDLELVAGHYGETPLHVAARRRRPTAVGILLEHGAEIDALNGGGKTAYAHAARRGFSDVAAVLERAGCDTALSPADHLAVAFSHGQIEQARAMLSANPSLAQTGNPEEDRLLADLSGRNHTEPLRLLIAAGADLSAPALDDGGPLHQAAWFGQPDNTRLLIQAGAPLDVFDRVHGSSPIGWAAHGSRFSGGAGERQAVYVAVAQALLAAGCALRYPDDEGNSYLTRILEDATPPVARVIQAAVDGR